MYGRDDKSKRMAEAMRSMIIRPKKVQGEGDFAATHMPMQAPERDDRTAADDYSAHRDAMMQRGSKGGSQDNRSVPEEMYSSGDIYNNTPEQKFGGTAKG